MDAKTIEHLLATHYEGLVRKTAARIEPYVEEDFEDLCQFFRFKVWKALEAFSAQKFKVGRLTEEQKRDRFVFACVTNAVKDALKKKRHNLIFYEDFMRPDFISDSSGNALNDGAWFEERYLSEEDLFAKFEEEPPLIPSTLAPTERRIVLLLYLNFKPAEIGKQVGLTRPKLEGAIEEIKIKMADWNPGAAAPTQIAA